MCTGGLLGVSFNLSLSILKNMCAGISGEVHLEASGQLWMLLLESHPLSSLTQALGLAGNLPCILDCRPAKPRKQYMSASIEVEFKSATFDQRSDVVSVH